MASGLVERPTGTVAFLFTDIENSSLHWASRPDEMSVALARHDELARSAFEEYGGHIFATGGDGFAVAFARADDAVAAAAGLQHQLADAELTRVRIGIHVGAAEERDGDYFGPVVNLAARVMSAGHGGQTLVTGSVADSVDGQWRPMGERVLSGFAEPVAVHQLGEGEFPPLRAPEPSSTNLRPALTPLLGREADVKRTAGLLEEGRLVTIAGVGGVGKTRLAVETASFMSSSFTDGGWIVELAEIENPDLLSTAVASALNIVGRPGLDLTDSIIATMSSREQLVLLDNCEHLLDSVADLVDALLKAAPSVRIIATSREPLDVDGEHVTRLRSLNTEGGADSPAGELFVSRAEAAGAVITDDDRQQVGAIIELLDGIPLAVELAAARARSLSMSDLAERLDQRFRLLRGGRRSSVERHQTLQATVDWSYELLSADEAVVFDLLSVFTGGASLSAVEAMAEPAIDDVWELPELLDGLVRKSMIQVGTATHSRYSLLETMRQYGLRTLGARGEEFLSAAQQRHAEYFRDWLIEHSDRDGYPEWDMRRAVKLELPNIRVALDHFTSTEQFEQAGRMLAASYNSLFEGGSGREISERAARIVERIDESDPLHLDLLGLAVAGLADCGQNDRAVELANRSAELAAALNRELSRLSYFGWAQALFFSGVFEEALKVIELGLALIENEPPCWETTVIKVSAGGWSTEPLGGPEDLSNIAVSEAEAAGSEIALALALLARSSRQPTESLAIADLQTAHEIASEDSNVLLWTTLGLARAAHRSGDQTQAALQYAVASKEAIEHGNYYVQAIILANLAILAAEAGAIDGAAEVFAVAREMERRSGNRVVSTWSDDLDTIEAQLAAFSVELANFDPQIDDRQLRLIVEGVSDRIAG